MNQWNSCYVDLPANQKPLDKPILRSLEIRTITDYEPDLSWLETEWELETVPTRNFSYNNRTKWQMITGLNIISSCRYSQSDVKKYGWKQIRKWIEQDTERLEMYGHSWVMVGVRATATILVGNVVLAIDSPGLWGIESDSTGSYIKEVGLEQAEILKGILISMNVDPESIETAIAEIG